MADEFELIKAFVSTEVRGVRRASTDLELFRRGAERLRAGFDRVRARLADPLRVNGAREVAQQIDLVGDEAKESSEQVRGLNRSLGSVRNVLAGLGIGLGAAATTRFLAGQVSESLELAKNFETAALQFEVLLGSQEKALALIQTIQRFTTETPFLEIETIPAARSLIAFGFASDEVVDVLRKLGDVAAGTGSQLSDLVRIFGRARLENRILAQELNQLTDRGIPAISGFADILGVAEDKVRDLVSEGRVGFAELNQLLDDLTGPGGQFEDLTIRLSFTAEGQESNIRGQIDEIKRDIGTVILPVALEAEKESFNVFRSFIDRQRAALFGGVPSAPILQPTDLTGLGLSDLLARRAAIEEARARLEAALPSTQRNIPEAVAQRREIEIALGKVAAAIDRLSEEPPFPERSRFFATVLGRSIAEPIRTQFEEFGAAVTDFRNTIGGVESATVLGPIREALEFFRESLNVAEVQLQIDQRDLNQLFRSIREADLAGAFDDTGIVSALQENTQAVKDQPSTLLKNTVITP